jgi:hypoxanthine phosphoribosyltransferase
MPELIPLLAKNDLTQKISAIAQQISSDYENREIILIGILKGAFVFLADLIRKLSIPVKIDFIGASSYGSETVSSESIRITKELDVDVKDKDVLIIEDIVDTGLTLAFIVEHLKSLKAKSVKICTLIDKRERRKTNIELAYACHVVKKGFIVGYGLDYAEEFRELPGVYELKL